MKKYILSVDQSTQRTKVLLFDEQGKLCHRKDSLHRQIINDAGWVSHDGNEIYENMLTAIKELLAETRVVGAEIMALGISNQRETSIAWNRKNGRPLGHAVVWQCNRAQDICEELSDYKEMVRQRTGIPLSPYFPAAKYAWLLRNVEACREMLQTKDVCLGTMDSYLVFRLTEGVHKTDYSNASRTQLFHLEQGCYDEELCKLFGIPMECLPEITDSDSCYGQTDLDGLLEKKIPIHAVMGDSHAALFGQECLKEGMLKATYGTGSSIMMNVGATPIYSKNGLASSVGFKVRGQMSYVLEGNLNYTGAVISWLKNNLNLIETDDETEALAYKANPSDNTCIVPAFTGLGAPYWDSNARAAVVGVSRTTGKAEIVKAALSCIAQQISDVVEAMEQDAGITVKELRVDGGPTKNKFLMQLQSDLLGCKVQVPNTEELSGMGVAFAAGMAVGLYTDKVFDTVTRTSHSAIMQTEERELLRKTWKRAISKVLEK